MPRLKRRIEAGGRKRKSGRRYACGKLRPRDYDPRAIAATQPHRTGIPKEIQHDPKAECILGRYRLLGRITEPEYDAGVWFRWITLRYRAVIGVPSPPSSISGEIGGPNHFDDDEALHRKLVFRGARDELLELGSTVPELLIMVAVDNDGRWLGRHNFGYFRLGLVRMAVKAGQITEKAALDIREQIGNTCFRNRMLHV